ncbi:uncharacterized protein B0H18DRAFT_1038853 [Fomitopsis serialis]|uniref:uncharacterized protein n=1 Tax=Fomitopsis serialis TaxID=139415 RepID=UPI002007EC52|nr:uncharacterized protein B0H18DRAFT_1038853 [Neoantrodia serialis]KAH9916215.1 hypothetical protein B0H18DRAFT_1038853 [Neoantrodia serialis]
MKKLFGRDKSKPKLAPSDIGSGVPDSYISSVSAAQGHERSRSGTPQPSEEHWHVVDSDAQSYSVRSTVSASYSPPLASSIAPSHISTPRALPSLSAAPSPAVNAKQSQKDRDREQPLLRKKAPNGHAHGALAAVGILKALDPHLEVHNTSELSEDNMTEISTREDRKERKGFWERKDKDRERDKDRDREREKDRERGRERDRRDDDAPAELTRMIGYLTATASEDWSLVLEVCERASSSEPNAKEAAKALRREFKYAEPTAQLSAARLWAIMLRNSSAVFTHQCTSRKFLDTLEDVVTSSRTSPVVRERLLEVLAAAAYASSAGSKEAAFRSLWKKVKPADKPDDGVPIDTGDAMFSPPTPRHPSQKSQTTPDPSSLAGSRPPLTVMPNKTRTSSRSQVIPPEEDMRRLFQECKVGRGNASLLSEALAFARPEDLKLKEIIREFYARCRASQELVSAQIPWAFAQAERSRQAAGRRGQPNSGTRPSTDSRTPNRTDSQVSLSTISSTGELTQEEQLLAALLAANEDLMEALRLYDDLERVGMEREAEERSRKETRMDRSHLRYEDLDHSYLEPGEAHHAGASSSRSPSPSSPSLSSAPSFVITTVTPAQSHPLPPIPSNTTTPTAKHHQAPPITTQGSIQSLAPPPHAPLGPRSPAHSTGPQSRTPSPERASLKQSVPRSSLDSAPGSLARDMNRLSVHNRDNPEDMHGTPVRLSAKALGKRRQIDPTESDRACLIVAFLVVVSLCSSMCAGGFDPDDIFYDNADDQSRQNDDSLESDSDDGRHHRWHQPVQYVYDAAAERTQERIRQGRVAAAALVGSVH